MSLLRKPQIKLVSIALCAIAIAGCGQEIVGTKNGNEGVPPTHNKKNTKAMGTAGATLRGELDCLWIDGANSDTGTILLMPGGSGYTTRLDGDDVVLVEDGVDVAREGDKISFGGITRDLPDGFADSSSTCADVGVDFVGYVNTGGISLTSTEEAE